MPGYTIKGFTYALKDEPLVSDDIKQKYNDYGWNFGDALHCRTRAVWDAAMLFISVKRLPSRIMPNESLTVYATIIDYSKKGLVPDSQKLHWRIKGELNWKTETLQPASNDTQFKASMPTTDINKTIEYYVSASSVSGKTETMPRAAPEGFYSLKF